MIVVPEMTYSLYGIYGEEYAYGRLQACYETGSMDTEVMQCIYNSYIIIATLTPADSCCELLFAGAELCSMFENEYDTKVFFLYRLSCGQRVAVFQSVSSCFSQH